MRILRVLNFVLLSTVGAGAQDLRSLKEPVIPPVCETIAAPLRADAEGPLAGGTPTSEDAESARQAAAIRKALQHCKRGHAVRLRLGATPEHSAFLIDPITLPAHRSLIIDGGVTVFASRNPARFQLPDTTTVCGEVRPGYPIYGCKALLTLKSGSGVYGYGVLDGQGHRPLIRDNAFVDHAWWDLLVVKSRCGKRHPDGEKCQQASPHMIYASDPTAGHEESDLTVYEITVRNPPFHSIRLAGRRITAWGVKVQAPWNVPNSDGFDINGRDILLRDITVAIGDENVAVSSVQHQLTERLTIDGATFYGKGGVALLGNGKGITDMLVRDLAMTGAAPSVETQGGSVLVNGRDPTMMKLRHSDQPLPSYALALPSSANQQAIQLNFNPSPSARPVAPRFEAVTFERVCLQDVDFPISIEPLNGFAGTARDALPIVRDIVFRNIHALAPTEHFGQGRTQGRYDLVFKAHPAGGFYNHFTLHNVVFDRLRTGASSLGSVVAKGNVLRTRGNVYPRLLDHLDRPRPQSHWNLKDNRYREKAGISDPALAIPCPASRWSFLAGDLYLSRSGSPPAVGVTDRPAMAVPAGGSVTLNAVLQPAMSQTTWFHPDYLGYEPGLLAIGSPALTEPVEFYEGETLIGTGSLGANGTLATATVRNVSRGTHTYRARYPGDRYYKAFAFGSVTVTAK